MKKKILALVVSFAMLICAVPTAFAYNVRDAYEDFAAEYPGFIDAIVDQGVSENTIIRFLRSVQNYLYRSNRIETITEETFDDILILAVKTVSNANEFSELQTALYRAYPDAAYDAYVHGRIHEDFIPLYESVKSMVFEHDMLAERDDGEYETKDVVIVSIKPARDVEIEKGGTYTLDATVDAESETGVSMKLDVQWTNEPSTSTVGTFTAEGQVIVPSGYTLASDVSATVTAKVTVVEPQNNGNDNQGNGGGGNGSTGNGSTGNGSTGNGGSTGTGSGNGSGNGGGNGGGGNGGTGVQKPDEEPVKHVYSFPDVDENTELGKAVYALSDIGIINGYYDGTFKPDEKIRRDEFAKIMVTAMESTDAEAVSTFTDVPKDQWAYTFIASAQKTGLIDGKGDGTFGPDLNIRRDEAMTIIYRALDGKKAFKVKTISISPFSDDASVAGWARIPIYMLAQNGIAEPTITTVDDQTRRLINPLNEATRGQCAIMVYNALKMMGKVK